MSELFELSRKYAEQRLELNRTKEAIREFAKQEGYEESAYIGDPVHFEVAGMRFTPIRVTGCGASQPLPPESEVDAMAEKLTKMQKESSDEPQWMKNDRERDTMVENGLHNMNKPLGYGEVAVACDDLAQE